MLPPIPKLEDYDVSPQYGFLPDELPLQCLSHPVYDRWERIINNFQSLLLSKRLRTIIDNLPILPAVHLGSDAEWRRAYSILTFMAHGYIWGGEKPSERLPPSITYPLFQICEHLEVPPVATYAAVCLWNWKPIFLSDKLVLDNLSTLTTFTGSLDEQWFYLVSVAIEARGGPAIPLMLEAIRAAREDDKPKVTKCLQGCAEILDELGTLLLRMYENCDPHVFYHRIRPYLAGSKNMKDAGLPRGVFYDDGSRNANWRQYGGGSNAQSSLIQFFDIILGVEHRPTGNKRDEASESEAEQQPPQAGHPPKSRHGFIHDMRQYMPGPHRRFLQSVESVANIREYVEFHRTDKDLTVAYDACLAMLRSLRDKHIQMVSRYIIVKSRESRSRSRSRSHSHSRPQTHHDELSSSPEDSLSSPRSPAYPVHRSQGIASIRYNPSSTTNPNQKPKKMRGTGGTALIPFLKQARDETGEPAIDTWVKRVLTGSRRTEADYEIAAQNKYLTALDLDVDETAIVGLAGAWDMEISGGGLCSY